MSTEFLIISLFFPRLSILWLWFSSQLPIDHIPYWLDLTLAVIVPRLLIVIWIYTYYGYSNWWFWLHIFAAFTITKSVSLTRSKVVTVESE